MLLGLELPDKTCINTEERIITHSRHSIHIPSTTTRCRKIPRPSASARRGLRRACVAHSLSNWRSFRNPEIWENVGFHPIQMTDENWFLNSLGSERPKFGFLDKV